MVMILLMVQMCSASTSGGVALEQYLKTKFKKNQVVHIGQVINKLSTFKISGVNVFLDEERANEFKLIKNWTFDINCESEFRTQYKFQSDGGSFKFLFDSKFYNKDEPQPTRLNVFVHKIVTKETRETLEKKLKDIQGKIDEAQKKPNDAEMKLDMALDDAKRDVQTDIFSMHAMMQNSKRDDAKLKRDDAELKQEKKNIEKILKDGECYQCTTGYSCDDIYQEHQNIKK
jgi:hypothetical protein